MIYNLTKNSDTKRMPNKMVGHILNEFQIFYFTTRLITS